MLIGEFVEKLANLIADIEGLDRREDAGEERRT